MSIYQRKLNIVEAFLNLENVETIEKIESFLNLNFATDHKFQKQNIKPFTEDEYLKRINQSLKDYEEGKVTEHSKLMASLKK